MAEQSAAMDILGIPLSFDPENAFEIVRKISVFELLSLLGIVIAVVSLVLSMRANIEQAETRAAEFSFRVWDRFREDDIQSAFLDIEWARFNYPEGTHNGFESDVQERRIDRLLSLLDDVASLAKRRTLGRNDVRRWSYIFVRVFDAPAIQRYMKFLDGFYAQNGVDIGPHQLAWWWYKEIPRGKREAPWARVLHQLNFFDR